MESVDIRDYKDAIMEAAWETGLDLSRLRHGMQVVCQKDRL